MPRFATPIAVCIRSASPFIISTTCLTTTFISPFKIYFSSGITVAIKIPTTVTDIIYKSLRITTAIARSKTDRYQSDSKKATNNKKCSLHS